MEHFTLIATAGAADRLADMLTLFFVFLLIGAGIGLVGGVIIAILVALFPGLRDKCKYCGEKPATFGSSYCQDHQTERSRK